MGSISGGKSSSSANQDVWGVMAPFLEDLYGRGQGLVDQFQPNQGLYDQTSQALGQQMNPQGNPYLNQMAGQFGDQLGQLNQQTGGQAALSGGYGGGRQGVAEHLNTQAVGQQMGQFYGQQYQQDQNRALGAIGMAPGVANMSPEMQRMQYLQGYAGLIGGPHNVGGSKSSSKNSGFGIG